MRRIWAGWVQLFARLYGSRGSRIGRRLGEGRQGSCCSACLVVICFVLSACNPEGTLHDKTSASLEQGAHRAASRNGEVNRGLNQKAGNASAANIEDRAKRCESAARKALAGQSVSDEELGSRKKRELLRRLYECAVVVFDDRSICDQVIPEHLQANCHARHGFWHDARHPSADSDPGTAPDWPAILAKNLTIECLPNFPEAVCLSFAEAVRRQEPERCPSSMGSFCRGLASAEPKNCEGDRDCEELSLRLLLLAEGGIEMVARKGKTQDRESAAASLGWPEACSASVKLFMKRCVEDHPH